MRHVITLVTVIASAASLAAQSDAVYVIKTVAGRGSSAVDPSRDLDSIVALDAHLVFPLGIAAGPDGSVYISERQVIRRFDPKTGLLHRIFGTFRPTSGPARPPASGALAINTESGGETQALTADRDGRLLFYAFRQYRVLRITNPSSPTATVEVFAGTGERNNSGNGGQALDAAFFDVTSIAADSAGNTYLADAAGAQLRAVNRAGAINALEPAPPCDISPFSPTLCRYTGFAADPKGNLVVADTSKRRIFSLAATRALSIIAGTGSIGSSGDGGPASSASFSAPNDVAVGSDGTVFIADQSSHTIRRISPDGLISRVAGQPGFQLFFGDGGPALRAALNRPYKLTLAPDGTIYFIDLNSARIRALVPCRYQVRTQRASIDSTGGEITVNVTTNEPGCPWSLISDASWASVLAPGEGTATATIRIQPNPDPAARSLTIRLGAQSVAITQAAAGVVFPRIESVANGASFAPPISPGSWITISGANLASSTRTWADSDFNGNRLPISLDGVSVKIAGIDAFVYFISPAQLNVLIPIAVRPAAVVNVEVTNRQGSHTRTVEVAPAAPAFFTVAALQDGRRIAAAIHTDGVIVADTGVLAGIPTRPARSGQSVIVFGTGFGAPSGAADGVLGLPPAPFATAPILRVGGRLAPIDFAGIVGPGLVQINFRVPDDLPAGRHALVATIGGSESSGSAVIAVE